MSEVMQEFEKKLGIDQGKVKSEHHIMGRVFPFHTRTRERVKFKDDFNEIVGIIARCSLGKEMIIRDISKIHLQNIVDRLDISTDISLIEIEDLFSVDFDMIQTPIMLQYFPVSLDTKLQEDESRGKKLLGHFITKLLKLDENDMWKNYITKQKMTDLYEVVYIESLPEIDLVKETKDKFYFFNQDELVEKFNKDLEQLMKSENFFISDIGLLISYYFFYYVLEQTYNLNLTNREPTKLWFSYDKERVTGGRDSVKMGYKLFNDASKELLINVDILDYLNILNEKDGYQTFEEIISDEENYSILGSNLMMFNKKFADIIGEPYTSEQDIKHQVKQLRKYLTVNTSNETIKRYRKSFDEFNGLGFIKSRGRLGYVLNASQELILLFVGIIVGDNDKILLNKLWKEFENRGIYFDKSTRREITLFFEEMNILEKLSDSGDAQYVKSIL